MTSTQIQYWDENLQKSFVREASDDEVMLLSRISGKPVPSEVTMAQARLALHAAGLLAGVQPAIDALPDGEREAAQIKWDYASTVRRDDPFTSLLGSAIGLDADGIDELFISAQAL